MCTLFIRSRVYIAGSIANEPAGLVRWIADPHSINQETVMPNLGISARDAADIAAYLYSLQ
jgi:cytochrome c1